MKKLESPNDIKRSERNKKIIVGFVLIFLMVFSTIGFALSGIGGGSYGESSSEQGKYFNGQYWVYPFGSSELYFTNDLEEISFDSLDFEMSFSDYSGRNLYVDSESEAVINEISLSLGRFAGRVQKACYKECEKDLPEKDCTENIIVWKQTGINQVTQEGQCIFIDGDLELVDAFLYRIFGLN
jgi:hypothetical protein